MKNKLIVDQPEAPSHATEQKERSFRDTIRAISTKTPDIIRARR
jgi:hypothetical protein